MRLNDNVAAEGRHRARHSPSTCAPGYVERSPQKTLAFSYFAFDFDRLVLQSLRSLTLISTLLEDWRDYKPTFSPSRLEPMCLPTPSWCSTTAAARRGSRR